MKVTRSSSKVGVVDNQEKRSMIEKGYGKSQKSNHHGKLLNGQRIMA